MSGQPLRAALGDYLAVRRSLGFKLTRDGLLLEQFVAFCEQAGVNRVTSDLAMAWVTAPEKASPSWLNMRLTVMRGFASWLQASDPATEVPERGWLPPRRRTNPYLYTDTEVAALMEAARRARWPLSAATYETLIGVLKCTGMRIGEAIRLDRDDLSLNDGLLTIKESKFGRSRQLVIHPTTVSALRSYLKQRAVLSPTPAEPALFVHPAGNRIVYRSVSPMFHALVRRAGLSPRSASCRPTIHGLRHTYAVNQLVRWYREGLDVQARLPLLSTWMGHTDPEVDLLVSVRLPRAARPRRRASRSLPGRTAMSQVAPTLQAWFTQRLIGQRQASPHTVVAYRDTFRLLFGYMADTTAKAPAQLDFDDLDATAIGGFLTHLERKRGVSPATRNARLAALRSFFGFAAFSHPEHAATIARVLAIPAKRTNRPLVTFLTRSEIDALLAAPDRSRWTGRRDHALLAVAVQTGLRVSELAALRRSDLHTGRGPHVRVTGKGRKERITPLTQQTVAIVTAWLAERAGVPDAPMFSGPSGDHLGRDAIRKLVVKHARTAAASCASIATKQVGVHTLRHSCAMNLLQSGVDLATIALWLGHEGLRTVQLPPRRPGSQERALARTTPPNTKPGRYRPPDAILAFLDSL